MNLIWLKSAQWLQITDFHKLARAPITPIGTPMRLLKIDNHGMHISTGPGGSKEFDLEWIRPVVVEF